MKITIVISNTTLRKFHFFSFFKFLVFNSYHLLYRKIPIIFLATGLVISKLCLYVCEVLLSRLF